MLLKNERKKRNPSLVMAVGALAAVGAVSIIRASKKFVRNAKERVGGLLRPPSDAQDV